ncbi:diguanylate cyclase domain-containing protein [Halothiobacillus sp. DCM-1]|uniref:diguanylate cyclase domain-containing protein n=1 Tax=Halothiobacillus sp. DCM-1 TaxID=3112558 RepID=UPI003255A273
MTARLATRFGLIIALVGVLAAGLTGLYGYLQSRTMLTAAAENRLLTATRVLARQVEVAYATSRRNALMLADHPNARQILQAPTLAATPLTAGAAQLFSTMLENYPEYFQVRLIGAAHHGLERVRVDRLDHGSLIVPPQDLQEKNTAAYVYDTLKLPAGGVYISPASINHEAGAHAAANQPTVQIAAPVDNGQGQAIGLIVISLDLNGLFRQLAQDLPPGLELYLTNSDGDFLIHPDGRRAFAFDRGQTELIQHSVPGSSVLFGSKPQHELVTLHGQGAQTTVAAFVRQPLPADAGEKALVIGLAQPLDTVLAQSDALGWMIIKIVLVLSLLAFGVALLTARAISHPLGQIIDAIEDFGLQRESSALPLSRQDELGTLARAFAAMRQQINEQLEQINSQRNALDLLARHDSLTGLPNRRVFAERLEQAIARAGRVGESLAVLFIDLDQFKPINDTFGHAAGDAVLQAVAERLRTRLRTEDTLARLGGDEFIALIDHAPDEAGLHRLIDNLRHSLDAPIHWQGHALLCTASIGYSRYPDDARTADALVARADESMYRAKAAGGNRTGERQPPGR